MNRFIKGAFACAVGCLSACAMETPEGEAELDDLVTVEQPMKNATAVQQAGVVELYRTDGISCTATLINKDSLITAAHCGVSVVSHLAQYKVLFQESVGAGASWRCLSGKVNGATVRSTTHSTALAQCPSRWMNVYSMDNGLDDQLYFPVEQGIAKARKNDFALVRSQLQTTWVETTTADYAYIRNAENPSLPATHTVWGSGNTAPDAAAPDHIRRKDTFTPRFHDQYTIVADSTNAQICSGDSGGPLGYLQGGRVVVAGVTNRMAEPEGHAPQCSIAGGTTYWANVGPRVGWIEQKLGKVCGSTTDANGYPIKYCWN